MSAATGNAIQAVTGAAATASNDSCRTTADDPGSPQATHDILTAQGSGFAFFQSAHEGLTPANEIPLSLATTFVSPPRISSILRS
jgi:hypothetical protein